MTKFITFTPYTDYDGNGRRIVYSAANSANEWLEGNPNIKVISWQATPVGDHSELCITIQYKENK